eukprot:Hpha_TRINITY_DN15689_c7_g1::TRINITY_DN15689_c7_g1_i1::g.100651::m.100651
MQRFRKCWWGCSEWAVRKSDAPEDVAIKRGLIPIYIALIFFSSSKLVVALDDANIVQCGAQSLALLSFLTFLVSARVGLNMRVALDVMMMMLLVAVYLSDAYNAAVLQPRPWAYVVLLLDTTLVFHTRRMIPIFISCTLVWLFIVSTETAFRFGLFDLVAPGNVELCDCSDPPCAISAGSSYGSFGSAAAVLLIDFYLTRNFATDLRLQLRMVRSSVEVAVEITSALARYDVDTAEKAIKCGKDLPKELEQSFKQLLLNLRSYKAYLPHSCLVDPFFLDDGAAPVDESERERTDGPECEQTGIELTVLPREVSWPLSATMSTNMGGSSIVAGSGGILRVLSDSNLQGNSKEEFTSDGGSMSSSEMKVSSRRAMPRRARVSLAAGNMIGFLSHPDDLAGTGTSQWIAADVEGWCTAVEEARGVVDLIQGDRRYASFNARRRCIGHASAAVEALSSRGVLGLWMGWTGCVVSGTAVCGSFGCATTMRFMVLGGVAASLHPFERLAARWGTQVLADGDAYSAACRQWRGVLLGAVFLPKRGVGALRVYSMVSKKRDSAAEDGMLELFEDDSPGSDDDNASMNQRLASELQQLDAGLNTPLSEPDGVGYLGETPPCSDDGHNGDILWRMSEVGLKACCG